MAPLLLTHFRARHRSVLTTLFTATFLGAVAVVAFPCPADSRRALLSSPENGEASSKATQKEVVVMMNQRAGRRRFMEEL